MDQKELVEEQLKRILEHLGSRLRAAGTARVESALGKYRGFFRDRRRPERRHATRLVEILEALHQLEVDPAEFFAGALERGETTPTPMRPKGEPPRLVAAARERWRAGTSGQTGRPLLDEIDALRYQDPRGALRRAEKAVDEIERDLLPRLLGVAASTWRILLRLRDGEHAIVAGIEMALEADDEATRANLLQRLAYVVADRGEYGHALRYTRAAGEIFTLLADVPGIAKTLVDRALWLYYSERPRKALQAARAALELLPEEERRNRGAAYQILGLCCQMIGRLREARQYSAFACEHFGASERSDLARIFWLRGTVARDLDDLEQARAHFQQAREHFRPTHPGDEALATTELVHVLLLQGQVEEAYETAGTLIQLIEPLKENPIVSANVTELLRCCLARHGLSLQLVERVRDAMHAARERQKWRPAGVHRSRRAT